MKVYQEIKESKEPKEIPKEVPKEVVRINPFGSAKPRDERLYVVKYFSFKLHPF